MMLPDDIVVINGPVVEIFRTGMETEGNFCLGIIYSLQLANGLIVTSPDKFPASPASSEELNQRQ